MSFNLDFSIAFFLSLIVILFPSAWNLLQFLYYNVSDYQDIVKRGNRKKISIVTAIKGEELPTVEEFLSNLSTQSFHDFELIIVSDDEEDTLQKIKNLARKYDFAKVIKGNGKGRKAGALNLGVQASQNDTLLFLDVEARLESDFMDKVSLLDCDAIAFKLKVREKFKNQLERSYSAMTEFSMRSLFRGRSKLGLPIFPNGSSLLLKKEVLKKIGEFKEGSMAEDLEIGIRLFLSGIKVTYIQDPLIYTLSPPNVQSLVSQLSRWAYGSGELFSESFYMLGKGLRGIEGFLYVNQWGLYILPFFVLGVDLLIAPLVSPLPFIVSLLIYVSLSIPTIYVNRNANLSYGLPFYWALLKGYIKGLLHSKYEWKVTPKSEVRNAN
ncbi:glycosyltransferase [Sulfolobus metallicus DSM 6482 = JCM 9184]|uniref:Glycosyltransferase n=1 Tax=Sulfuracidifex metallicus DSM 6482 = JCM 9184 TaxID=523847 RepID=A0A6A9QTX1_SULME|nr:glycosyltransferase family 2 protein [Sulfuracidifex metallicus]MUN29243.1 glycosyltransferase [Sulfuracidifex metallicus DSM 6482 = JCM 9184]